MVTLKGKYITEWDGGAWRTKALIKHWSQVNSVWYVYYYSPTEFLQVVYFLFSIIFLQLCEVQSLHHLYLINTHIQKRIEKHFWSNTHFPQFQLV